MLMPRRSRRFLFPTLVTGLLAACGSMPAGLPAITPGTAPDVTWLRVDGAIAQAVPGKVLVKFKHGRRSVQGLMNVQALSGLPDSAVCQVPTGSTVGETLAKLRHDPAVAYAEPDYVYHAVADKSAPAVSSQLWGMAKIHAPEAWATTTGDPGIKVAVVDTGVDYTHEDLKGQVVKGPNLVANTDDPMDDQGHGSHVAGTIAGIGANGVFGVAFKTQILAIKVLGSDGSGDTATIAQGILKASELGAKVINLSLGGPQPSQTLEDAVNQATAKGALCVVAAGNDGTNTADYPAGYPNALAVGATDQSDARATFSNYGSYVSLAAPGVGILSSTQGSYKQESGTSMASPHVAGAAALLLAKNSQLTPKQLKDALVSSGDPTSGFDGSSVKRLNVARALTSVTGSPATPTPAPSTVPANPVSRVLAAPTGVKALAASTTQVQLVWNAEGGPHGAANYRVYRDGSAIATPSGTTYQDGGLAPGSFHAYTVVALDDAGTASPPSHPANVQLPSSADQLTVTNITLKGLTGTSATIGWTTNVPASERVDYTTRQLFFSGLWYAATGTGGGTTHSLTLNQLYPGGIYYLKVTSTDAAGNRVTAGLYGLQMPL